MASPFHTWGWGELAGGGIVTGCKTTSTQLHHGQGSGGPYCTLVVGYGTGGGGFDKDTVESCGVVTCG
jgi:hypothetical protein